MKAYVKPNFEVTEFELNETIAVCDPEDVYEEVRVPCVIWGSHDIFYDKCDSNYNNMTILNYNGSQYLLWRRNHNEPGGNPSNSDIAYLKSILASNGYDPDDWQDYHAGKINAKIEQVYNQSR